LHQEKTDFQEQHLINRFFRKAKKEKLLELLHFAKINSLGNTLSNLACSAAFLTEPEVNINIFSINQSIECSFSKFKI
jgi:hypothetical protein